MKSFSIIFSKLMAQKGFRLEDLEFSTDIPLILLKKGLAGQYVFSEDELRRLERTFRLREGELSVLLEAKNV